MYHEDCNATIQDYKTISVAKLIEILQTLPPDWEVWANHIRNFSLGDGKEWKGYIDIGEERVYPPSKND
jgi:hypothetical protein